MLAALYIQRRVRQRGGWWQQAQADEDEEGEVAQAAQRLKPSFLAMGLLREWADGVMSSYNWGATSRIVPEMALQLQTHCSHALRGLAQIRTRIFA